MKKQIFDKEWVASIRVASVSHYSSIVIRSPYKLQQHWVQFFAMGVSVVVNCVRFDCLGYNESVEWTSYLRKISIPTTSVLITAERKMTHDCV
jgi:hypothetical protein